MAAEKKREPEACILCGLCNRGGDAYKLSLDERRSPRHAVWSCRNGRMGPILYAATLNGRPEELCPVDIGTDAAVIAARRTMVKQGQETVANRGFMAKLREGKNPHK